jgi:F-type H+-transporting ATPase subunit gamma
LAEPTERVLLPAPQGYLEDLASRRWPGRSLPMFRMDRDALLSWLLQEHLFVALFRGMAESLASEHASRLAAMQAAERNIDERRGDLRSAYRRKRQETITRELMDVVAGFESAQRRD